MIQARFCSAVPFGISLTTAPFGSARLSVYLTIVTLDALTPLTRTTAFVQLDLARTVRASRASTGGSPRRRSRHFANTTIHPVVLPVLAVVQLCRVVIGKPLEQLIQCRRPLRCIPTLWDVASQSMDALPSSTGVSFPRELKIIAAILELPAIEKIRTHLQAGALPRPPPGGQALQTA